MLRGKLALLQNQRPKLHGRRFLVQGWALGALRRCVAMGGW